MASLRHMFLVKGKTGQSAESMRALIHRAGHALKFEEMSAEVCTVWGTRADNGDTETVTFTIGDAERAGLVKGGGAWESYPRAMLIARATTELARLLFGDVIG